MSLRWACLRDSELKAYPCLTHTRRRQWTTRLYYMALSPFRITWALDSNVYQCEGPAAHGAVQRFLAEAERTSLWAVSYTHLTLPTKRIV